MSVLGGGRYFQLHSAVSALRRWPGRAQRGEHQSASQQYGATARASLAFG